MSAVAEKMDPTRGPTRRRPLLREVLDVPRIDPAVIAAYRPSSVELSERIVARIVDEVAGFSATTDPSMRAGIHEAITRAVRLFVDTVAGAPTYGTEVYSFYRWLGTYEANVGHNLDAMRAAHHIATQESWADLRRVTREMGQPAHVVGALGDALHLFQNRLFEQALLGFMEARSNVAREEERHRSRLLVALIGGSSEDEVRSLASQCSWSVPDRLAVVVTRADDDTTQLASSTPDVLAGVRDGLLLVIAETTAAVRLAHEVAARCDDVVAVSWAVEPAAAHDAVRWARRGFELAGLGIIVPDKARLVRCEQHTSLLCLHADPVLRRLADEAVLAPLLQQTPKRRLALAETMLLWLQTRESAPALAARLGVHDQTVRHRLRHVKTMFGSALDDPCQTVALLTALESVTARWRQPD